MCISNWFFEKERDNFIIMRKKYSLSELLRKSAIYLYCLPLGIDRDIKNNIWREKYKAKLEKYIGKPILTDEWKKKEEKKYIFTAWLQGENNAPVLVKKCLESISAYKNEYELVIITKKNVLDYIEIPPEIMGKWERNIISNALFTDYVRVALLFKYSGIWIDATVMLFDNIPNYIRETELFFFQQSFLDHQAIGISNWFISSKYVNNPVVGGIKMSLENYWNDNDYQNDYYLFHDMVSIMSGREEYRDYWNRIPYYNNVNPHVLQHELKMEYSLTRFSQITKLSPIQKLTYKINIGDNEKDVLHFLLKEGRSSDEETNSFNS